MKKITVDGVGYYLSCMLLFHVVYALRLAGDGFLAQDSVKPGEWSFWMVIVTLAIVCGLAVTGLVFTVLILKRDDSVKASSSGKSVTITELEDLTGENYFTNYSLLVLTGLSLPTAGHLYSLGIYLLLLVTLGLVYIKKALIYMNPVLTLMNYSIYSCKDKESGDFYVFVVQGDILKESETIRFQNMAGRIVRLKKVVRD